MGLLDPPTTTAIVLVARLCLGLIFLPSALGKLANQSSFIQGVIEYRILPEGVARAFGLILPWIELGIALALIIGIALPLAGMATSLLLISFIAAVTVNLRRGRELECNCYEIASPRTISWGIVVRNVLLLLLAAIVVGLAQNTVEPGQWSAVWQMNHQTTSSFNSFLLLFLLLTFCFAAIHLSEWTADIHYRLSRLQRLHR